MKKLLTSIIALCIAAGAFAQDSILADYNRGMARQASFDVIRMTGLQVTNPVPTLPPPESTFFNSVLNYFTSFNTHSTTFLTDHVDVWAGADTIDSSTTRASLGISALLGRSFEAESITRNGAIGGTVVSEQAGVGYCFTHYDTRFTVFVDGGYRFDTTQWYAAPGARVMKALTDNTFAGASLELPIYFKRSAGLTPTFSIFTGFKF